MAIKSYSKMKMVNIGIKTRPWLHIHHFLTGKWARYFYAVMWNVKSLLKITILLAMWIVVFGTWQCFDLRIRGSEYLWLVLVGECNSWRLPQPSFYLPTIACSQLAATCGRPLNISSLCIFFRMGIGNGQAKPRPTANEGQKWFSFWEPNYLVLEIDESLNKLAKISISFILEW